MGEQILKDHVSKGHRTNVKKPGHITIKVKNVQSIREEMGQREEAFLEHLRRTTEEWDVWMATGTWRQKAEERIGIEDGSEEERTSESTSNKKDLTKSRSSNTESNSQNSKGNLKDSEPPSLQCSGSQDHILFGAGSADRGKGVAIVVHEKHVKGQSPTL